MRRLPPAILIIPLGLSLFIASASHAQSPRKILFEEFINTASHASRAYDSMVRPMYFANERLGRIVPLVYHTPTPGSDGIYLDYRAVNDDRFQFYGLAGKVPSALVNGLVPPGASPWNPADTARISSAIGAMAGTMSPFTITITRRGGWTDSVVTVRVASSAAIRGKRLIIIRAGVSNREIAGESGVFRDRDNGLNYHAHTAQGVISPDEGYFIDLAAGEAKDFVMTVHRKGGSDEHLVAFVQDPDTREVLQAESDFVAPILHLDHPLDLVERSDAPGVWNGSIALTRGGRYVATLYATDFPAGWSPAAFINGKQVRRYDTLEFEAGMAQTLYVGITPSPATLARNATLTLVLIDVQGVEVKLRFSLYSGATRAMLLKRMYDGRLGATASMRDLCEAAGVSYATADLYQQSALDLDRYVVVPGEGLPFDDDVRMARELIDNGVRLFVYQPYLAYTLIEPVTPYGVKRTLDTEFVRSYLHVDYQGQGGHGGRVIGVAGDPIADGLAMALEDSAWYGEAMNELIVPRDGAAPIFHYDDPLDPVAGIRYRDARNGLVYLTFRPYAESLAGMESRATLVRRAIEWLEGRSDTPEHQPALADALGDAMPNPASGRVEIPFTIEHASRVALALYAVDGRLVATLADGDYEAGRHGVAVDGGMLASGSYVVVMRWSDGVRASRLAVVH